MSIVDELSTLLLRDLDRLADEVAAYPDDESLWTMAGAIPNSGGTLALHLAGNLQHFIGALLGATGYVRKRDVEFSARGLTRAQLLAEVTAAREAVAATLGRLGDEALARPWTGPGPLGDGATTGAMLIHLSGHLMYHIGQINYHRRLLAAGQG